nr:MAG TPA: hypothetical protein [Caudoviricetes sp.]
MAYRLEGATLDNPSRGPKKQNPAPRIEGLFHFGDTWTLYTCFPIHGT